jgi:phosphohistidine phosphatase
MKEASLGLNELFRPEAILSSPILRAKQTADILADVWKVPVSLADGLGNGDHRGLIVTCASSGRESLALVGHEPWMGELLSTLLTGEAGLASSVFRKGAAALVSTYGPPAAGNGTLEWLLQPGMLRRLGRAGSSRPG